MRKYLTEIIGTFFLVLTIVLSADPFVIGAILMAMIYAGGHISGAHYNPAVTLAILIRGSIKWNEAIPYMVVQIAGATVAPFAAGWLLGNPDIAAKNLDGKIPEAIGAEIIGTFALAFVILNVATARGTSGNSFYGLAIGFTVFAMASALGGISGGAFNPAVAIGMSFFKAFDWSHIWVYLVGCFGGAILAALVFNFSNPDDK